MDRIRLSNSDDADVEDAKFVLGNADTNLDQEDILPSISNNSVDVDDGDGDSSAATSSHHCLLDYLYLYRHPTSWLVASSDVVR